MCQIRLTAELLSRPEPPHPMLMNEGDFVSYLEIAKVVSHLAQSTEMFCSG